MVVSLSTFLFADLCGFTAYAWRHGDERSAELAIGFQERVMELAAEELCEVVKTIGDAVMVRAADCRQAVRLARRIHRLSFERGYPPIRIGIDTGTAVQRNGDWYGTTVNTAARVADVAAPGEMLMTERVLAALTPRDDVELVELGPQRLKGLPDCALHAASSAGA